MSVFRSARMWLAGPAAFGLSVIIMLGMAIWFPIGSAGINQIVLPLVMFPLIWAFAFFYAYLNVNINQVAAVFCVLGAMHIALLVWHFQH